MSFWGGGCCFGVGGIIWGLWASFGGGGCHLCVCVHVVVAGCSCGRLFMHLDGGVVIVAIGGVFIFICVFVFVFVFVFVSLWSLGSGRSRRGY